MEKQGAEVCHAATSKAEDELLSLLPCSRQRKKNVPPTNTPHNKRYVHVLIPETWEYYLIWKMSLHKYN